MENEFDIMERLTAQDETNRNWRIAESANRVRSALGGGEYVTPMDVDRLIASLQRSFPLPEPVLVAGEALYRQTCDAVVRDCLDYAEAYDFRSAMIAQEVALILSRGPSAFVLLQDRVQEVVDRALRSGRAIEISVVLEAAMAALADDVSGLSVIADVALPREHIITLPPVLPRDVPKSRIYDFDFSFGGLAAA